MRCPGMDSIAGPLVAADAAPASDKDTPATPNAGKVVLRRLRLELCFAWTIAPSLISDALRKYSCPFVRFTYSTT
jgi:hypothetical protein